MNRTHRWSAVAATRSGTRRPSSALDAAAGFSMAVVLSNIKYLIDIETVEMVLHKRSAMFDVVVIGGGPAGLSAALMLGRCRRRVLVCDLGQPRNRHSRALHGYLTRDGIAPHTFAEMGRQELSPYGVEVRGVGVTGARRADNRFAVALGDGGEE